MKINVIKIQGSGFIAASDEDVEKLSKFENGLTYSGDFKLSRNPKFLAKMMVFFKFCFNHWDGSKVHEHCSELEQFERFRKDLTILAGFYIQSVRLDGSMRTEAKSLAFENMEEDEFTECYHAVINAAMKHIFKENDQNIYNQLINFF